MFNTNLLEERSRRRGCEMFSEPTEWQRDRETMAGMTFIYHSVQLDAVLRNGSFKNNIRDHLDLRTCI